jgi:hypothetical protein
MLELNENPIAQPTSKFNLSFKSKLQRKHKGRPKKASKQVVFNKSAKDRENQKTKKRQKQQKRRKVTDVLADMTNTGEDDETDANLSGSELIVISRCLLTMNLSLIHWVADVPQI